MEPLSRGQNQIGPHSIRFYLHWVQTHVLTWVAHSIEWSKYHLTLFFFFATKYKTSTANLPTKATIKLSRHDIYLLLCKSCPTWVLCCSTRSQHDSLSLALLSSPLPPGNEFPQRNDLLESPLQLAPPSKRIGLRVWIKVERKSSEKTKRGKGIETYMLTTWQEELWLKVQSHVTELSKPFLPSKTLQFPSPLQGSIPKSQSFFPSFFPISLSTPTAPNQTNKHKQRIK